MSREFRIRRSSALWQVSSGKVGTALGCGPRSPTMSSSGPMKMVFLAHRFLKFKARSTVVECLPAFSL